MRLAHVTFLIVKDLLTGWPALVVPKSTLLVLAVNLPLREMYSVAGCSELFLRVSLNAGAIVSPAAAVALLIKNLYKPSAVAGTSLLMSKLATNVVLLLVHALFLKGTGRA